MYVGYKVRELRYGHPGRRGSAILSLFLYRVFFLEHDLVWFRLFNTDGGGVSRASWEVKLS